MRYKFGEAQISQSVSTDLAMTISGCVTDPSHT